MSKLQSKISVKTVCGAIALVPVTIKDDKGDEKVVLRGVEKQYMRVAGIVRSIETKSSAYGESVQFNGDFRAINLADGEINNGAKLFLPKVAESFVENAFLQAEKDENFTALEVAFDIGVKPASNAMGYEYTVQPLIEKQQDDFLGQLLGSLPPLKLQAPQPEKETKAKTKAAE